METGEQTGQGHVGVLHEVGGKRCVWWPSMALWQSDCHWDGNHRKKYTHSQFPPPNNLDGLTVPGGLGETPEGAP